MEIIAEAVEVVAEAEAEAEAPDVPVEPKPKSKPKAIPKPRASRAKPAPAPAPEPEPLPDPVPETTPPERRKPVVPAPTTSLEDVMGMLAAALVDQRQTRTAQRAELYRGFLM